MIERTLDEPDGIIFVRGTGEWTIPALEEHYAALRVMMARLRDAGRRVRVLIDSTASLRQPAEVEAFIKAQADRTYRIEDRVAIVLADGDMRQHVQGLIGGAPFGAFTSRLAAEMWLMEEGLPPPG